MLSYRINPTYTESVYHQSISGYEELNLESDSIKARAVKPPSFSGQWLPLLAFDDLSHFNGVVRNKFHEINAICQLAGVYSCSESVDLLTE